MECGLSYYITVSLMRLVVPTDLDHCNQGLPGWWYILQSPRWDGCHIQQDQTDGPSSAGFEIKKFQLARRATEKRKTSAVHPCASSSINVYWTQQLQGQ